MKFKDKSLSLKACKNPRESLSPSGVDVGRSTSAVCTRLI